jgi:hypothetical protein
MTIAWLAKVVNGSKVGTAVDLMLSAVPASCVGERRPLIQLLHQRAQRRVVSVTRDQELFTLLGGIAEKAGAIFRAIIALRLRITPSSRSRSCSTTAGDRHLSGNGQPACRTWSVQSCRGDDRGDAAAGHRSFPDVLFPEPAPEMIKRLDHLDLAALPAEGLSVRTELDRVLLVVKPTLRAAGHRIHFAEMCSGYC